MKKEYRLILLIVLGVLALILLKKPIEFLLLNLQFDKLKSHLLAGSISRILIVIISIIILKKLNLQKINGLNPFKIINYQALIIPTTIIFIGIYSSLSVYQSVSLYVFLLFLFATVLVGFTEELVFRGIILPLFLKSNREKKNVLYTSVIYSSLLFGLIHYINLIREPKFDLITSQVIFAFCIGCFFGGLYLRVGNVFPIALIHGFFNFAFGTSELKTKTIDKVAEDTNWVSLLFTLLAWFFILGCGIIMIRLCKKDIVLKNLEKEDQYTLINTVVEK